MNRHCRGLLVVAALALAGCTGRVVDPPAEEGEIRFGLVIPATRPAGEYYLASGVVSEVRIVKVGDSLVPRDIQSFSAQFTRQDTSIRMPLEVSINGTRLSRHRGGDTLRLAGAGDTSLLSINTWRIVDSSMAEASYTTPVIDVVDSVLPMLTMLPSSIIRADSSLTLRWRRPVRSSGGLYIEWQAPNDTIRINANDGFGFYQISADDMKRVRGAGRVTLTRYINGSGSFQGLRVITTRLAQRSYEVSVQ